MKAYIQSTNEHIPHNYNFFSAYQGFKEMGFETVMFYNQNELLESKREDVVVGYVDTVRQRLYDFGIVPSEFDYPKELKEFLGRKIWSAKDLVGCGTCGEDPDIVCSEIVNFKAEWRCFVRYGKILDIRPYKGDWRLHYNSDIIEKAVAEFTSAPKAYAIDFGLTDSRKTLLIEVNDGYALGSYGLFYLDYAKLLSARWSELTDTADECAFDILI